MPFASIDSYVQQLSARQAELKILIVDAVCIPHMKERDRRSAINGMMRAANIRERVKARRATPAMLKLMGIGVEHVQ